MAKEIAIGEQSFEQIIKDDSFYIDKTYFIRQWWERKSSVTLITRPRRFGKTLNMNMLYCFFSNKYKDRGDLFEELDIWKDEKYRNLQGTYPVIFITFAGIKATDMENALIGIRHQIREIYLSFPELGTCDELAEAERNEYKQTTYEINAADAPYALKRLSAMLYKKVLILLDEYDTPLQEAWSFGYWQELVQFTRLLFNNTFKTNPYMGRAVMTGITRVSRESL
ncbi:MAG: AAA family ATPase, partial [Lachnospiraceae bacterium]|nr:AAA family ATPase [Lachnospiraceae bacterium]